MSANLSQLYDEHTAKLPDGTEVYYTDSGAPRSNDYTTLVALHGSGFNGAVFEPLHEFAHRANLRIVVWNRRDYRGSTKYTDDELADLRAGRQIHQDRLAFQLASFLGHFIETKDTPKLGSDRKTGGFILMGWSFGNATTLSLFANPNAIPEPLYDLIEPYIMSFVLYDPPFAALGYPTPDYGKLYDPWTDPACLSPEQRSDNFQRWVTSYYKHPNISSGKCSGLDYRKHTKKQTFNRWSDAQKALYYDKTAAIRTELPSLFPPMQRVLKAQSQKALFDESLVVSHFPNVHVFYISGSSTCWCCIWAYMESMRLYKEAISRGQLIRTTSFHLFEGGNHFLQYDFPELFLRRVLEGSHREFEA